MLVERNMTVIGIMENVTEKASTAIQMEIHMMAIGLMTRDMVEAKCSKLTVQNMREILLMTDSIDLT